MATYDGTPGPDRYVGGDDAIEIDDDVFAGFARGELRSDDCFVGAAPLPQGSDAAILFNTETGRLSCDGNGAAAGGRVILAQFDAGRPSADDVSIV